jgi:hypothetical protein
LSLTTLKSPLSWTDCSSPYIEHRVTWPDYRPRGCCIAICSTICVDPYVHRIVAQDRIVLDEMARRGSGSHDTDALIVIADDGIPLDNMSGCATYPLTTIPYWARVSVASVAHRLPSIVALSAVPWSKMQTAVPPS